MIGSLYISDAEQEESIGDWDNTSYHAYPALASFSTDLGTVIERVNSLEADFRDSVNSALNREDSIRGFVNKNVEALEHHVMSTLKHFEEKLVDCLQRRDEKWKAENPKAEARQPPCCP